MRTQTGDSEGGLSATLARRYCSLRWKENAAELQARSPLALFDELGLRAQQRLSRSRGLNGAEPALLPQRIWR